jgi:hypothetical protein
MPPISRRGSARLSVAHAMTNPSVEAPSLLHVVQLHDNSVHLAELESGPVPTLRASPDSQKGQLPGAGSTSMRLSAPSRKQLDRDRPEQA